MEVKTDTSSSRIFVTVQGGQAEVCDDTVPEGVTVEILNFDNLAVKPNEEIPYWSDKLREYWLKNHKAWGRCESGCPCRRMQRGRRSG